MSLEEGARPPDEGPVWVRRVVSSWWVALPLGFGVTLGLILWGLDGGPSLGTRVFVPVFAGGLYLFASFVTLVVFKSRGRDPDKK
jgi:hypothetical protein